MPLTASAPFAIARAQPPERRRVLVLCVSLGLHATMLYGIGLLAQPALRDIASPAVEMMFDPHSIDVASAAPPDPAMSAPAPLMADTVPSPAEAAAPPPAVEPPRAAAENHPAQSHPAQRRPAARTQETERAVRRQAPPPTRAAELSAPPAAAAPAASPVAAAPVHMPAPVIVSSEWQGALASWIRTRTRYPEEARRLGQQGAVTVSFTVGRDGQVLAARIAHRSGSDVLDQAALEVFRAARVPAFPAEMLQAQMTISVPVRYRLEQ